jgi:hypothetical protein
MRVSNKTNAVWKVCLGMAVLMLLSMEVSPTIYGNGSNTVYDPTKSPSPNPEGIGTENTSLLEVDVVRGAGYFLKSCSDFLLFLEKAELAELEGPDFAALNANLGNAIANMELARDTYIQLKQQMDATPYDPVMIDRLLKFNYEVFQKKNNLIKPVFDEVRYYLGSGAVREFSGEIICQMDEILTAAYGIRANVEVNEFPAISSLWDLQHKCVESMLFGQYGSRVFLSLSN